MKNAIEKNFQDQIAIEFPESQSQFLRWVRFEIAIDFGQPNAFGAMRSIPQKFKDAPAKQNPESRKPKQTDFGIKETKTNEFRNQGNQNK